MVIETISRALKIRSIYKYKYFYAWPEPHSGDLTPFGAILTATSQFHKPILLFHCKLTLSFMHTPTRTPDPIHMRSSLAQTIPFMYRPPMQFSSMPCATIMLTQNPPKINKTTLDQKDKKREHTQTRRKSFDVPDPRQPCRSIPTTNNPGVQLSSSLTIHDKGRKNIKSSCHETNAATKSTSIPSMPRLPRSSCTLIHFPP